MHARATALAALMALAACRGEPRPTPTTTSASAAAPSPPPPASAEELALLAPVTVGSDLGGFEVRAIHGVRGGVLRVVCVKDRATVRLDVALADPEGPVPPASAGKFAVYYGLRNAVPEQGEQLAKKLADAIRTHADAAPPPGMTKFVAKPRPGTEL